MECSFYFEVIAPNGLVGIEELTQNADIGLYIYHSKFNNKKILKSKTESNIELSMETSTTDLMQGSGYIKGDFGFAKNITQKLSNIFQEAGYHYKIGVDDENGKNTLWLKHKDS